MSTKTNKMMEGLKKQGYKWAYMFKNSETEFMASKTTRKKNGDFRDDSNWDFFALEGNEEYPYQKGEFICLQ